MSELFEDEELIAVEDKDVAEAEKIASQAAAHPTIDARRRLERLLEEKRLREELEDFSDLQ